ncbi:cyclase family protein [Caproiciproducens galactitolivorans]|uniref:Cyclase family protein n=1 Tax=Caproiciproducens galactitolivorans TaxID=642589 RepID=A0ABT4BQV6_9FIRM|nr:cyclase family protein [Caproiciproducens galactitolivorans]MCY1713266.1 cyclase family protein [Caproiciproducens galactitolivorans]
MKVIDISRELFSAPVYPGDPMPRRDLLRRMDLGDVCNLSGFYTGCHGATHIDAPCHFIEDGKTVGQFAPERFLGECTVIEMRGIITGSDIDRILPHAKKNILFKGEGEAFLSESGAFALTDAGVLLVGTDAFSIETDKDETYPAHRELLGAGVPILEGLNLSNVEPGDYRFIALPLLLGGAEASPVRAILIME